MQLLLLNNNYCFFNRSEIHAKTLRDPLKLARIASFLFDIGSKILHCHLLTYIFAQSGTPTSNSRLFLRLVCIIFFISTLYGI